MNAPYRNCTQGNRLDMVSSSSADITRSPVRGCFRGGFVYVSLLFVSFCSKAKENHQRCGDVFSDILITSKRTSVLAMFGTCPLHRQPQLNERRRNE